MPQTHQVPEARRGWRAVEVVSTVVLAVVAAACGLAGAFVQGARPGGTLLALAATAATMILARRWAPNRIAVGLIGAAWLAPVIVVAVNRPEGDVVIASGVEGLVFLFGGVLCIGVAVGLGGDTSKLHTFE